MYGEVNENDWILFRKRVPGWQERIFSELVENYSSILASSGHSSERFWKQKDTLDRDLRIPSLILDMRRSKMDMHIMTLLGDGVITLSDLEGFSDDVLDKAKFYLESCEKYRKKDGRKKRKD